MIDLAQLWKSINSEMLEEPQFHQVFRTLFGVYAVLITQFRFGRQIFGAGALPDNALRSRL
jgi:hypothetical protein